MSELVDWTTVERCKLQDLPLIICICMPFSQLLKTGFVFCFF